MRLLSILLFTFCLSVSAEEIKKSQWKGYERHSFNFEGRKAFVTLPKQTAEANPWVWRARFPGWHTEMDAILLEKGCHIVYADVAGLLGSPKAVSHWDKFYPFITEKYGLAKKMTIECVSRGGLISFNWAKQNPEKVNAIYAEAPVCDIKSWPGGKGKGVGAKAQWTQAQKAYEMDEAGLMAWKENPIDDIALLAKAGVPLFFVIHKDDMIVPNAENTDVLVNKYREAGGEAGGEAQVHVHTGESKSKGHHFKIEKIDEAVEFILKNSKK